MATTTLCPDGTWETFGITSTGFTPRRCTPLARYRLCRNPHGHDLLFNDFRNLRIPSEIVDRNAAAAIEGKKIPGDPEAAIYVWDTQRNRLAYTGNPVNHWVKQLAKEQRVLAATERRIESLEAAIKAHQDAATGPRRRATARKAS